MVASSDMNSYEIVACPNSITGHLRIFGRGFVGFEGFDGTIDFGIWAVLFWSERGKNSRGETVKEGNVKVNEKGMELERFFL